MHHAMINDSKVSSKPGGYNEEIVMQGYDIGFGDGSLIRDDD